METERLLYELGKNVQLVDRRRWGTPGRDYPGDGLLFAPFETAPKVRQALTRIDRDWRKRLEILRLPRDRVEKLMR